MAIEAQLADGRILEFPDGTDPSVIQATVKRIVAQSAPPQERTFLGGAKELFKGMAPGAVGLVESAATGASALLPESMEKTAREKIKSVATAAKEPFTAAAGYEESVPRKLGEAIGSTAPFLLAGPLGLAGRAAAVGLGVGAGAGEARTRAEDSEATGEQRGTATALGAIPGALEAFAPFRILSRIPEGATASAVQMIKRSLLAGGEEAAQETASGLAQNMIAKGIYKPEQALIEGLGEQAAYGGATGAIIQGLMDLALGRRAKGAASPSTLPPAPEPEPKEEVVPGAKLREDAPAGTQGKLFTRKEMGSKIPEPKAVPEPPSAAVQQGEQLGLGLDFQRDYNDLATERDALRAGPRTAEARTRIAELSEQMASYDEATAGQQQAEEIIKAQRDAKKAKAAVAPAVAEPVVTGITQADIDAIGLPLRTSKQWVQDNVLGKTVEELQALVQREPNLINNKGARAEVLKALIAPQPTAFEEKPNVPTTTQTDQPQGELDLGGGEPSVGVPSEPAGTDVVQPGAGVPPTTGASETPDGLGLAPAGQPVSEGTTSEGAQPTAITTGEDAPFAMRAANKREQNITSDAVATMPLLGNAKAIFTQNGDGDIELIAPNGKPDKVVRPHDPREGTIRGLADFPDYVPVEIRPLMLEYQKAARADYYAKGKLKERTQQTLSDIQDKIYDVSKTLQGGKTNAPTTTTAPPSTTATTTTTKRSKTTAKPAATATAAKETKAPAPAVATETVDEEAARKAEAEDFKRRLEELERKQKEAPKAQVSQPAKVTPTAKPAEKVERETPAAREEKPRSPFDISGPSSFGRELQAKAEETREGRASAKAVGRVAPDESAKKTESWTDKYDRPLFQSVYSDGDVSLVRTHNAYGQYVYLGMAKNGRYTQFDIEAYIGNLFTPDQKAKLIAERAKAVFEESKKFSKNPDGPFTGATTNVVKSDSVDQRYADYLRGLMQDLGLGDVRIFLVTPDDMRSEGATEKYKLYKDYASAKTAGSDAGEEGSNRVYGPDKRDFYISFNLGQSEAKTLEVISHELGHSIQSIAYDNAAPETKAKIRKEYDEWLASTKGKTGRELVQMLRNRETAETQMMSVPEGKTAEQMTPYWKSFSEWFADNVSRWATTSEKPLTVTEKFFSKVAQMMRDLVAVVTGRKYPPAKSVAAFLDAMGPADAKLWLTGQDEIAKPSTRAQLSSTYTAQDVVTGLGPLTPLDERSVKQMVFGMQKAGDPSAGVKFRVAAVDSAAAIEEKFSRTFNGAVRNSLGKINPMGLYRQAQDYSKILAEYFQNGTLVKDKDTGLYRTVGKGEGAPVDVFPLIYAWGAKTGRTNQEAEQFASRVLEAKRLDEVLKVNPDFPKHLTDRDRAVLVAEYNSDPVYAQMNAVMDKPRLDLIDKMVEVGRLSKETATEWKSVIGYVPFDRIEDFTDKFSTVKKTTGRSPLALTKDPELVGSFKRPVGNVFENYLNTMGWMVGQVMNNDARVQTLTGLQELGFTKAPARTPSTENRTAKAYVNGELKYWELPSTYDVAAFQDLNPPKMAIMRTLGAFSNILRKSVTLLPPFALKQVTDDVQRAMLTSGVKSPTALLRMTLANFGSLAWAEIRGIQHPIVKEFGALGLTGEYDFEAGKPAVSVLKDLGYRDRTVAGSKLLGTLLHRLDGITRASDLAVRKAIYEQTMIENNKDQLLAQTRAREFINFRRRGASEIIAVGTATIPFFNAYMQGMDVLYRAASGKDSSSSVGRAQARQLFWSRAGTVAMLSAMYALMSGDDEDYQDMDLRTRNSNWILPGGYKIPVPGELGALFKVIPETVMEYLRRSGTPEEQTALEAIRSAAVYMAEQYIGRTVPIPQAVKPLIEAWTNYSFFTGRELEGIYQKQQDPSMRVTSKTSELAQAISNFSRDVIGVDAVSPIQIDNMLNGYFGSTAALVTMMTDSLLNPSRVDRPLHKYALLSNYLHDPVGTRRLTEFYDMREGVGKANNTLRQLAKTDMARAEAYAESHQTELELESAVNSTLEQLERTRAYRKFLNSPDGAAEMSREDREKELEEIKKMEVEFTRWVREAKTELRKVQ
jgi:hypothetical protein